MGEEPAFISNTAQYRAIAGSPQLSENEFHVAIGNPRRYGHCAVPLRFMVRSPRWRSCSLDGSDMSKLMSREFEPLDVVRDGSAKPRDHVAFGPQSVHTPGNRSVGVSLSVRRGRPERDEDRRDS